MAITNSSGLYYPLTKMNFLVTVTGVDGVAAFSEVTGFDATVDVIEFRQGNSSSLAPVKLPGLVKHGNVTLKMGYVRDQAFKTWVQDCVSEHRPELKRQTVTIELIDISGDAIAANGLFQMFKAFFHCSDHVQEPPSSGLFKSRRRCTI